VVRHAPGAALERSALPAAPEAWLTAAERLAAAHPGAGVERKARGFVLHYREVPSAGADVGEGLRQLMADDPAFQLLAGNLAWEIRPQGADKGRAVAALMQRAPFAGRLPVFIGDDVTDHDGIAMAQAMGGAGLLVADAFGDPAGVRAWLMATAEAGGW
ncbi:MAG: trehalose-phosphatase, partial [Pseudomonadota bacterium]|nr:trehalose-phosphatase [Pseudomonadota bacterium]